MYVLGNIRQNSFKTNQRVHILPTPYKQERNCLFHSASQLKTLTNEHKYCQEAKLEDSTPKLNQLNHQQLTETKNKDESVDQSFNLFMIAPCIVLFSYFLPSHKMTLFFLHLEAMTSTRFTGNFLRKHCQQLQTVIRDAFKAAVISVGKLANFLQNSTE